MKRRGIERRDFLKSTIATTAGVAMAPSAWSALSRSRVYGANERVHVGVIGFRSRGRGLMNEFRNLENVSISGLSDVDQAVLDKEHAACQKRGEEVLAHQDFRKLLDSPSIDAIVTATPNHWHALISIWACQAGKDAYIEKPVCHNIWEGGQMVRAARKHNRIVQVGTQCRSSQGMQEAMTALHDGKLGKILWVRGLCYKPRNSIGRVEAPKAPPKTVDYNLWSGPAPLDPIRRKSFHYDWHWQWAYGNGDIGNQGPHQMDLARWAIGADKLAPRVLSVGGRLGYVDDGQTPNSLITIHDYEPAPIIFEVRGLPTRKGEGKMDDYRGARVGLVVECEKGSFVSRDYSGGVMYDKDGQEIASMRKGGSHAQNFIDAVRSRRSEDLNADVLEGHLSAGLCHMSNISYRLGTAHAPENIAGALKDDKDLTESFDRLRTHLEANEVDYEKTPLVLGKALVMDTDSETFTDSEANKHLSREYRAPFEVPSEV